MKFTTVIALFVLLTSAAFAVEVQYLYSFNGGCYGLASTYAGNVFITRWSYVRVYDRTGSELRSWPTSMIPWRAEVDNQGYVYICEGPNAQFWPTNVCKYTEDGSFLGPLPGAAGTPTDVASDDGAYLYIVSDYAITKVTTEGSFVMSWGSKGSGPGQFDFAQCITVGADGNVYVAETDHNHRVQVFTSNGSFITMWGAYGNGPGLFLTPRDITMDRLGYIHVADNDGIELFTKEGSWVTLYGEAETGNAENIDATPTGYVFVASDTPDIDVYFVTDAAVAPASLGRIKALFR